ncbi:MAG: FAD:protein FMN transferase [Prevotella sp.]|nr:FAD:protein FMN transferase [Prevotella sp.]
MDDKRKKQLIWQVPFLTLLIVGTVLIIRQQRSLPYQSDKGSIFGTFYTITYQSAQDYHQEITAELQKVDTALSMFNEQSVISQINREQGGEANEMFMDVFNLAMKVSQETNGAFDITVAPLVNAWGFGFKGGEMPTRHQIDSIRHFVGWEKVTAKGMTIKKSDRRVMLDCSAIAKGYGVDVVARLLKSKGITNFMVEIGGEIVTCGISPKRLPWKIGVVKPTEDSLAVGNEYLTILNVTDKAMATSGNYRRFYYKGGKRYAHTIDPKTGYPVQHSILSATVLADDCATADAYATSFMVMGLDKAKVILDKHTELMAYLIYTDQDNKLAVWFSPSLKDKIEE